MPTMQTKIGRETMKAVIIAGGMGTRLESATPKILHKIGKATILDHQIRHLTENGITQIYLSLGYNNQQVIDYVQKHYYNKNIHFIVEQEPSGTGGFLKLMKNIFL
ncbi:MAG: Nucleoside-diphosphate-sugar pyrophosphorylase [Microgenomates group bacterium GW2011_GWD1_33_9]|nr:MAG: Nucleoside-diphosphate-sugar pyrophosphorylase [Microgenomates group bacterium GW2011_GWD1_33_9]